jgi:hypothetical protein
LAASSDCAALIEEIALSGRMSVANDECGSSPPVTHLVATTPGNGRSSTQC